LIAGRPNPWAALYDPARKTFRAAKAFLSENLNVARQYGAWLTGGDVADDEAIAPGTGAVVRCGLHKLAVFRDERGRLHEMSATCPQLGCLVEWNSGESPWDCPCHGSRFDRLGQVINGPANVGLRAVQGVKPSVAEATH